ncbi:hypothetical protein PBY51_006248 [Eleginops maclovinus]|uniref:Uncharacterized protein n=1 Tax=Eleginops maclovinus TaxID=56733 RepID=A0AAN8A191_ELEMC|nr:hypothetical protein PBY51_006248 [Eleginops maclovinus]
MNVIQLWPDTGRIILFTDVNIIWRVNVNIRTTKTLLVADKVSARKTNVLMIYCKELLESAKDKQSCFLRRKTKDHPPESVTVC